MIASDRKPDPEDDEDGPRRCGIRAEHSGDANRAGHWEGEDQTAEHNGQNATEHQEPLAGQHAPKANCGCDLENADHNCPRSDEPPQGQRRYSWTEECQYASGYADEPSKMRAHERPYLGERATPRVRVMTQSIRAYSAKMPTIPACP